MDSWQLKNLPDVHAHMDIPGIVSNYTERRRGMVLFPKFY
jgi:hypothetical protein